MPNSRKVPTLWLVYRSPRTCAGLGKRVVLDADARDGGPHGRAWWRRAGCMVRPGAHAEPAFARVRAAASVVTGVARGAGCQEPVALLAGGAELVDGARRILAASSGAALQGVDVPRLLSLQELTVRVGDRRVEARAGAAAHPRGSSAGAAKGAGLRGLVLPDVRRAVGAKAGPCGVGLLR